jgi:hypothetical protein
MKNKILALLASVGLVASASAVDVNENLKIQGFLDFSYTNTETDNGATSADAQTLEMDEVEIDFLFNVGDVSGEVHLDNGDSPDGDSGFDIEQAHFTYSLDNGVSFTFGNYGSNLGFEREDPAGLYTYSRAYGDVSTTADSNGNVAARASTFNLGDVDSNDVHGVVIGYAGDNYSITASLHNPSGTRENHEDDNADLEVAIAYTGIENVNLGVGYYFNNRESNNVEEDILNFHVSTSFGKVFVAGEYTEIQTENVATGDLDAYLLLLDYDFNDKFGAALRISSNETNINNEDFDKITIAPNYAITDSLGAIIEYSDIDQGSIDINQLAVELTYTF